MTVTFNGGGDEGQIQEIHAVDAVNMRIKLPQTTILAREVDFERMAVTEKSTSVHDLLETLTYKFLDEEHSGWGDGEGGFGNIVFTAADQSIRMEFNERYVETNYYEHQF